MNKETIMKFLRRFKIWGLLSELFDRGYIYRLADVPRQSRQSELLSELMAYHRYPEDLRPGLSGTTYTDPGDRTRGFTSQGLANTNAPTQLVVAGDYVPGEDLLIGHDVPRLEMDTGSNVGSALTYSDPAAYERAMGYQFSEEVQSRGAQTSPPPAVPEGRSLTSEEIRQMYDRAIIRGSDPAEVNRTRPGLRTEPSGFVTISGKELDRLKVTRNGKFTNEGRVFNFKQ